MSSWINQVVHNAESLQALRGAGIEDTPSPENIYRKPQVNAQAEIDEQVRRSYREAGEVVTYNLSKPPKGTPRPTKRTRSGRKPKPNMEADYLRIERRQIGVEKFDGFLKP